MQPGRGTVPLVGTVLLAFVLWFISFYLTWSVFWFKIAASAAILAVLSLVLQPHRGPRISVSGRAALLGLASAALLYGIFAAGKTVSTFIFPFAEQQIGGIYGKGQGTPPGVIILLLCFVTGPAEEMYWRGYLQRHLMARCGNLSGWILATAAYSAVHIWSLNVMLIGAAAVAGAFWGAMYWGFKDLTPVIISHAVWSAVIFAVYPMG